MKLYIPQDTHLFNCYINETHLFLNNDTMEWMTVDNETISFSRQDMSWGPEAGDFNIFLGGASDSVKTASFKYEN